MPAGSDGSLGTEASETSGGTISSQLAYLVPSFDPSKDDLQLYQQKVQLVFSVWPSTKVNELITRLILNTSGTAFAKLQLHQTELCINDEKGVKRLIELLGGHWGRQVWKRGTLMLKEHCTNAASRVTKVMTVTLHVLMYSGPN